MNTIKKFSALLFLILIIFSKSNAFSPEYEKKMYVGCYANSKAYIGSQGAKKYCLCTINKLSSKFSNEEIDLIFKKKPEEIIKITEFASIYCENNK